MPALHPIIPQRSRASLLLRVLACILVACAALLAGCSTGNSEDDEDDGDNPGDARLTVVGAALIPGAPPPPSLDPDAPRLDSTEERVQTTQAPADVPIDVTVDAEGGVAALLLRVNQANEHFRLENPDTAAAARAATVQPKAEFSFQLILRIPELFDDGAFCVDVAGEDLEGRVSNYQRICFVLPDNDPAVLTQPRANAGGAQAVTRGNVAILDGSGSESADGSPLATYQWTQLSGSPAVTLRNANTPVAEFDAPADTGVIDLGFRLTVTDGAGRTSTNDTTVRINEFTLSDLAGSWFVPEDDGVSARFVITFFADGTYIKGGREDDPECNTAADVRPDGNGVEWGRFDYNTGSGQFQVQEAFFDNDGDCGLFERNQTVQDLQRIVVRGNQLDFIAVVTDNPGGDFDQFTLTRVPDSGTGIVGSWQVDIPETGPDIVTFFADGHYVVAAAGGSDSDCAGTETGAWSVDATNVLTTSQFIDNACVGFDNLIAGTTLQVNAGRLELSDGDTDFFDRLPRPEILNRSVLLGAWYWADPLSPPASAAETNDVVRFRSDGTYLFGGNDDDPNCDEDYGNANPDPAGTLDPDGNGAEEAHWLFDPGSGRALTVGPVTSDSNGSCGFFDRTAVYPGNSFFARAVDANTLDIGANGDFDGQLLRIPSTPPNTAGRDALIGAWEEDTTGELLVFFADGTFFFVSPIDNGGIERGNWTFDGGTQLTVVLDPATNPRCIDTIGSEDSCITEPGVPETFVITLNPDRTVWTAPSDPGDPDDPPGDYVYRKIP